jgi:hypothetical protein
MTKNTKVSFHVRHEVKPERILDILKCVSRDDKYDGVTQADRQIARAKSLGLINAEGIKLTSAGALVLKLLNDRENLWGDIAHFLHYTLWSETDPGENGFSWMYRELCDYLYNLNTFNLNATRDELEKIATEFNNRIEAEEIFAQVLDGNPSQIRCVVFLRGSKPLNHR